MKAKAGASPANSPSFPEKHRTQAKLFRTDLIRERINWSRNTIDCPER
jgi:hypothetical protein